MQLGCHGRHRLPAARRISCTPRAPALSSAMEDGTFQAPHNQDVDVAEIQQKADGRS